MNTPAAAQTSPRSDAATMRTLHLKLTFLTPAFLGDAEQNARWRTPPIKHLLREWWRVRYFAANCAGFNVARMRETEGKLFGHAWLENDTYVDERGQCKPTSARQSLVRSRLLAADDKTHAAAIWGGKTSTGVAPINSKDVNLGYAWFGLVRRGPGLPDRQRIETGETRVLALAFPGAYVDELQETLRLIRTFGTVGSRSRGGWGSLHLGDYKLLSGQDAKPYSQQLKQCLSWDWAAAIACDVDGSPWLWRSSEKFKTWDEALAQSARWRRDVRTALKKQADLRPALGFASPGRMPSPLRWKVIRDDDGFLRLQAVAMPHRIPKEAGISLSEAKLQEAWTIVRDELDRRLRRVQSR